VYTLARQQTVKGTLEQVWSFLSDPRSLPLIVPSSLDFQVVSDSAPQAVTKGELVRYQWRPVEKWKWRTMWILEFTSVEKPYLFIHEQHVGLFDFWRHEHHFQEVEGGVEVTNIVNYGLPFGVFGMMMHSHFREKLDEVFDFRKQKIQQYFGGGNNGEKFLLIEH
jgi:ligand-binding SRPBCC domain-containing protein